MSQSGVSDEAIIQTLVTTHSYFRLSQINASELKMAGVSEQVINFLYKTSK